IWEFRSESLECKRMSPFQRHRWFVLAGAITLAFALVSLTFPRGFALIAIFDLGFFLFTLAVGLAMLANAWAEHGVNRRFWLLMGSGCLLWACDSAAWTYYEVLSR